MNTYSTYSIITNYTNTTNYNSHLTCHITERTIHGKWPFFCLVLINLLLAWAALFLAFLLGVLEGVENFQERWTLGSTSVNSLNNGNLSVGLRARAASRLLFRSRASRLFALQFTLGLGTVGGLGALVLAVQLFANRSTLGFRSNASSVALSRFADGFTLGATFVFTFVLGATDGADRFGAVDSALGASDFFTLHLTLGAFTNRVTYSRARRIITLPLALRMALFSNSASNSEQNEEQSNTHDCLER